MQFKIDENLPADAASALTGAGHDAVSIHDQKMTGSTDTQIASVCKHERRILLTLDLDFADIRTFPPADHPGMIVMRLRNQDKPTVLTTKPPVATASISAD